MCTWFTWFIVVGAGGKSAMLNSVRDWSLITGRGAENGKIAGPKPFVLPLKTGHNFLCPTLLRIDNSWQGMIRATLLYSAAILSTVSYYTSNYR